MYEIMHQKIRIVTSFKSEGAKNRIIQIFFYEQNVIYNYIIIITFGMVDNIPIWFGIHYIYK